MSVSNRRRFMQLLGMGSVGILATVQTAALAAEKLDEMDPLAMAYAYKHDASDPAVTSNPAFVAGRNCANCMLYIGSEADEWAPCSIFQNKLVAGAGWCMVWAPKG